MAIVNARTKPHYYKRNGKWRWHWKISSFAGPGNSLALAFTVSHQAKHHCRKLNGDYP